MLIAVFAPALCPQEVTSRPEIRGLVIEPGTNHGVDGVTVNVIELPGDTRTIVTDAQGAFRIALDHFGAYSVAFRKEGYSPIGATNALVTLDKNHLSAEVQFSLGRRWDQEIGGGCHSRCAVPGPPRADSAAVGPSPRR